MNTRSPAVWLPASHIRQADVTPVAKFVYHFDALAALHGARPSTDPDGGGTGPGRYFFLRLGPRRLAAFSTSDRKPGYVELSLRVNARGVVYWEDYEDAMAQVNLPLEEVRRQGGYEWRRRAPQTEANATEGSLPSTKD